MDEEKLIKLIASTIKAAIKDSVETPFLSMLAASEGRIDETNKMISKMSDSNYEYAEIYKNHLASLEASRDSALRANEELILINKELVKKLSRQEKESKAMCSLLKERLDILTEQNRQLMSLYNKIIPEHFITNGKSGDRTDQNQKIDIHIDK